MKRYFDFKRIKQRHRNTKYKSPVIGHYTEAEWNEIRTKNVPVIPTPIVKPKPAPVETKVRRPRIR